MDGFEFLRDAWKKFADKADGQEIAGRLVRSAGAGGKALVDRGLQEFPKDYIQGLVDDAYALVTSKELAEGISLNIRSFDEEKIKQVLDSLVTEMKKDENAAKLAQQFKQLLSQADNDQVEAMIERMIPENRMNERIIFKMAFMQARPVLDEMREMNQADLAEKIKELADAIPTDLLALQAGAATREITPERLTAQAHGVIGQLPSGKTLADIVHGLGQSASKHFDTVSKARTLADATKAIKAFTGEAANIVAGKVADDKAAKKKFDKKGGGDYTL